MAEDHGLGDGQATVEVAEGRELVFLVFAHDKKLFDGVQGLLLTPQSDDVGVGHHLLSKPPHGVLKGGGEEEHLAFLGQLPASVGREQGYTLGF